jgi:alkylation response protein AidB-like acyl-CoA dehydrogenase
VDFAFGEDQELLRATTRSFLAKRHPIASVRAVLEVPDKVDRDVWRAGAELGWTAMLIPAEYDGGSVTDQPVVDLVPLAEELGRVLYPGPFVETNVVADAIARNGTDGQRKELLGPIARGECLVAWCLSGDGTLDPAAIGVRATRAGDGWLLDGRAGFVLNASDADLLMVGARAAGEDVAFLVPLPAPGVTVRAVRGLDLTRSLAEVTFERAPIPEAAPLSTAGERALDLATVLHAAEAVGAAELVLDATVQYAKDRVQFGRPIGSFQAIKHRLANLKVTVEAMRASTHYAALALDDGFEDATAAVHTVGAYVGDAFAFVCGEALQLHGGIGFTWEDDIHLFLRRAKVGQVLYGDSAWHRDRLVTVLEPAPAKGAV